MKYSNLFKMLFKGVLVGALGMVFILFLVATIGAGNFEQALIGLFVTLLTFLGGGYLISDLLNR